MEEDKIGKETRALQVPCGSETSGYNGENNRQNASPETTADKQINEKDIEEKEG